MEAPEEDTEFLTLTQPVKGATLRLSDTFFDQDVPCTAEPGHLLAVSNHFGWLVAASSQGGFGLFSLPTLRATVRSASPHDTPKVDPTLHVPTPSPVDFLRFAMGEKLVVAGLRDGSIAVWRLKSLVEGQSAPLKTLPALVAGESLIDLCPNPAPDSPLLAVLAPSAAPLTVFNLETSAVHATFPADLAATSACWSVKGKQLAVGTASGTIVQLSPEGEQKALVPPPAELATTGGNFQVRSVEWLENNVFLATYAKPRTKSEEDVEHEDEVYVITKAGQEISYTKFADPCPPFGMMGRQGRRWVGRFRNWEPFKHLLVMVNAPSADIGVLAQAAAYSPTSPSNGWATLTLPEDTRPTMPTGDKGDDACPLALELDLSASAEEGGDPAVLVYTSRGALVYWTFKNERAGGKYEGMIKSRDILTQENEDAAPTATAVSQVEAKSSPAPAPVSTTAASKPTAFGAFAAPAAFGAASTPPAFGSSAAPTRPPVSAFGSTAFGASTASPTPAFGTTSGFGTTPALGSGFGAFGSSTAATSSPFGTPAIPTATTPAAGSAFAAVPSSGGFSAFGSVASKTTSGGGGFGAAATGTAPKASPFGSGSAFGSAPAFGGGATTAPSSGGFAAFGAAKPAAGGFGAFGGGGGGSAAAVPGKSVFGAGATASAFGSGGTVAASPSSSSTTTAPKFSFAPTATRGAKGSDDEDDEEGMGDDDDDDSSAKPRVDEPPDLEPTKTGLGFGQSVREAEKAGPPKRDTPSAPAPATESLSGGFGSLGFGATSSASATSQGLGTSVFGPAATAVSSTAATPGLAAPAKPAFGFGAAATAPTSSPFGGSPFSFGQLPKQVESPASQETKPATSAFGTSSGGGFAGFAAPPAKKDGGGDEPKPTFSFAPKTPETPTAETKSPEPATPVANADEGKKKDEATSTPAKGNASTLPAPAPDPTPAPAPAPPPPAFSFAPAPAQAPAATEEKKPSGTAFGFGGTAGGFGAFAAPKSSTPAAKDDEQKPAAPSTPVTTEDDSEAKSPEEEDEAEEDDDDSDEEESNEDSDNSTAEPEEESDSEKSTTAEPAAPTKPAFSFAPSGSSTAFPKSTGAGGFGAFAGGSSSGFGFGAAAPAKSPSTGTGFGFGVAATPSPSAASTGFSFAPKTPSPAAAAADAKAESKPAFSFAPAAKPATESSTAETKPTFSFAPKSPAATTPAATSAPAPVSIPAASLPKAEKPKDTTKSLFGFASSPPEEKLRSSGDGSLLSRLGAKEPSSEDEAEEEEEAEDGGATGEEDEEEEDEEEEDEEEGASSDELDESEGGEETAPAVAPSGQPSLLSRLSPAPPSPTPSQPTAVKESEAAKAPEPVKAPSFSFAPPPADAPKTPSFSFAPSSSAPQTAPSLTPATPPVPSPTTSRSPGGFLNFTSTAPRSSSPLSAPPLAVPSFSAAPAKVTPAPAPTAGSFGAPASKPSFSFGTPAATSSPSPAINVAGAPTASTPPAVPAPSTTVKSLAPSPAPTPAPTPPAPAPAAKPVEPAAPRALSVASTPVPKLGSQLIAAGGAKPPGVTEQGMAGEFLKAYLGMQQDFELLRKNSAIIKDFVAGLGRPCHPPLTKESRPQLDAKHWSFGDVDKLKQLTREAQPGVEALHAAAVAQKRRITELQSQILKAETKREEASRFLRARSDPAFAKLVRVRQLGPEQIENQRKIRHQVEAVRAKIEQLEEHLLLLKKQLAKEKLGQSTLQAPSLDSIQRAMRNIMVAATEKGLELDEIAARLHRMQVAERGNKPTTPRKTSFAMSPLKAVLDQSSILRQSGSSSPRSSAPVNGQGASEAAAAALSAERVAGNLKKALLSLRASAPLVNRTACGSQTAQLSRPSAEIQLAFSHGPITGDRLPRPRHFSPPRAPVELPPMRGSLSKARLESPVAAPTPSDAGPNPSFRLDLGGSKPTPASATSGTATAAPPPLFPSLNLKAAPSFSFATPVASSPPPSSSATSGSRGLRTSSRTHAGAAQLKSTGTPQTSASSNFDWGPLPSSLATTTPAKSTSAPANFISLSSTPAASPAPPPKLPLSLGAPGLPASIPHKAPISFGTTPSATPVKPPPPSSSFGFGSTTPAATATPAPSFSFGTSTPALGTSTPALGTSTPAAPPASKAPAFAGSFGFGGSGSTTPSKPAPSFSFGTSSTPTVPPPATKASSSFSFGAPPASTGTATATPFSFAGPAPPTTSKSTETAQEESDGSDADSAEEEGQPEEHEDGEEEWEGDEFGDEDYGDDDEEEEGLDAISEHTDEE